MTAAAPTDAAALRLVFRFAHDPLLFLLVVHVHLGVTVLIRLAVPLPPPAAPRLTRSTEPGTHRHPQQHYITTAHRRCPLLRSSRGSSAARARHGPRRLLVTPSRSTLTSLVTDGIPIKTTLDNSTTVQYAGLLHQLTMKARSTVRDIDPQNDLTFLRIRSKKHEIMVSTGVKHASEMF
uniref:Dynein light chain roadblock-type 2 n=1 Tax=Sinocyclocheilus grahami TaxID=75366 RepID=A0A672QMC1_SINGR